MVIAELRRGLDLRLYDLGAITGVRDGRELERIAAYIESNPVQARLTVERSQYRWSSAWEATN